MTFETFDQSDEETWPSQRKLVQLCSTFFSLLFNFFCKLFRCPEQLNRWPCPSLALTKLTIWVFTTFFNFVSTFFTDYKTENWEPGFTTIFVTWQLIVTLDSIRNSCDVYYHWVISVLSFPLQSLCKCKPQWESFSLNRSHSNKLARARAALNDLRSALSESRFEWEGEWFCAAVFNSLHSYAAHPARGRCG